MIEQETAAYHPWGTVVYTGSFSTLPRVFWWGWDLLNHQLEFSPLWMHDTSRHAIFAQVTSALHFHYTIAGRAILEYRKQQYILESGQAYFIVGPEYFSIAPHPDSPNGVWENLGIMISGGCQIGLAREIMEHNGPLLQLHNDHPAIVLLQELIRDADAGAYRDAVSLSAAFHPLLLLFCHEATTAPVAAPVPISAVITYMRSHYHLPLTLRQLADYSSYSVSHFSRHFRAQTDLTPMEYLTRLRLTIAIEALMGQPDLTVARVATACGFGHKITLYKVTQQYLHCTPTVARQLDWGTIIQRIWPEPPFWLPDV